MATIEKRDTSDGTTYRVKVRMRGYPATTATFDRITDAKRWASETETRIREGRYFMQAEAKRHTVADLVDRYLAEKLPHSKVRNKRERALYARIWRDRLGPLTLADLTAAKINEVRQGMLGRVTRLGKPVTPSTINRQLAVLSAILTVAVKEYEWMDDSPMRKVGKLPEPRGRVRFLSDAERDALLRECGAHSEVLHTIVVCALSTGARKGELLGLRWADVDMTRALLTFHQTKNGERRTVPLVGVALDALRTHAKVRRLDTDLVFPGTAGTPLEIGKMFREACTRAGIADFRFHDLRHTAASYLAMNGATLAEIAEVLGHKTLQMVRRYTHLTEGHTRGVLERMAKSVFGQ